MMNTESKDWILKVISGPHQGAEMALSLGSCLVGNDEDCDVVLHDVLIAPQHFSLDLTEDQIKLVPLGGRVFCDGFRVKDAEVNVKPLSFITVGATSLVIGPSDQAWPLLSVSDVPDIVKEPEEPEGEAAGAQNAGAEGEGNHQGEASADRSGGEEGEKDSAGAAGAGDQPPVDVKARRKQAYAGIGLGVFLLVIWAAAALWFRDSNKRANEDAEAEPVSWEESSMDQKKSTLQSFIASLDYGKYLQAEVAGNQLKITGFAPTNTAIQDLRAEIQKEFSGVLTKIRSIEDIAKASAGLLKESGLDLAVEVRPDGMLKVRGKMSSVEAENWKKIKAKLTEIPGVVPEALMEQIVIMEPGVPVAKNIKPEKPVVRIDPEQFKREHPEAVIEVIGMRNDGMNWVKMKNGDVIFKGGRLANGGVVEAIEAGSVLIRKSGSRKKVGEGDLAWDKKE